MFPKATVSSSMMTMVAFGDTDGVPLSLIVATIPAL